MTRLTFAATLVCGILGTVEIASAAPHKDETFGYRIVAPRGWEQLPVKNSEKWIVARFRSAKPYAANDGLGNVYSFKADMRVIVLSHQKPEDDEGKAVGVEDLEDVEDIEDLFPFGFTVPFKDYKDYVKRTYSGGGWFISYQKERKKRKKYRWTHYEIKVDKLARQGKKRLIAGVFHGADADYVVQYEVTEDSYQELRSTVYGSLKTFDFIPRKEPDSTVAERPEKKPGGKLTAAERAEKRDRRVKLAYERALEKLPKDWDRFEYKKYFYVLSHVDRKFAVRACRHGEAIWKWMDQHFSWLGEGHVRPIVVRICANEEELMAYHTTSSSDMWFFFSSDSEVVLSQGGWRFLGISEVANWGCLGAGTRGIPAPS